MAKENKYDTQRDLLNEIQDLRNNIIYRSLEIKAITQLVSASRSLESNSEVDWHIVFDIVERINNEALEDLDKIDSLLIKIKS